MGVDFRLDVGRNCGANCSRTMYSQCSTGGSGNYSAGLYAERGATVVRQHAADEGAGVPLFLYTAFQSVHAPIQAPPAAAAPYQHLDPTRRTFGGMLAELDAAVGHVRSAFEAAGMWENTLTVFTTDNGGPVGSVDGKPRGIGGATGTQNWPLRGGKGSYYQGGVRGTAWVHGSFLHAPGAPTFELMHAVDWLPTFVEAAGGPAAVAEFEARGLPLDGKSQWGALVKGTPGPHEHILINIERDRPTTAPPRPRQDRMLRGRPVRRDPGGTQDHRRRGRPSQHMVPQRPAVSRERANPEWRVPCGVQCHRLHGSAAHPGV